MLNLLKRNKPVVKTNTNEKPSDKLVDGDLPWGWVTANKDFTNKIEQEFHYFWQTWIDSKKSEPRKERDALKSLLLYMDNVQKLCDQKGECFSLWCSKYLIGKQKESFTNKLTGLEENMNVYTQEYEKRKDVESYEATLTDKMIFDTIRQHEGILQKDFYKLFDSPYAKEAVSEKLYFMAKEGKIERIKSGNSYILKLKD